MEELLSLARKAAEKAEVFLASFEETPVVFEANRLKQLQTRQGISVALRVVRHGRIGFSTATRLEDRASLVERAVEVSQFGIPARFELPAWQTYPQVEIYDPGVEAYPVEQMVNLGEDLISRVRGHTPDILCEATIAKSIVSVQILNSRGGRQSSVAVPLSSACGVTSFETRICSLSAMLEAHADRLTMSARWLVR